MRKIQVNKIGVASFGKVVGFTQAIIAFVYGLLVSFSAVAGILGSNNDWLAKMGISLSVAVFAVFILPLVGFVFGWVQGVIAAAVLNVVFSESKGLELEVQDVK
ncbi:hypothetical protein EPO04_00160 [Patescibacteria group bacterium]|nr:MAG: hypothetical protein EPO04_00160 [Patescibacteria group bacterium]